MARIEDFKAFVASYKEACERGSLKWLRKKPHVLGLTKCLLCLAGM